MKNDLIDALRERSLRPAVASHGGRSKRTTSKLSLRFREPPKIPLYAADLGVIGALVLALLFVINPTGLAFERITATKHIPLLFSIMALLMAVASAALEPGQTALRRGAGMGRLSRPFLLLASWVIVGSLYARYVDHVEDTFLTIGLYMLAVPGMTLYIVCSKARWRIVALYMKALSLSAGFMLLVMIAEHVGSGGRYHELEYLVVPIGVYHALRPGNSRWQVALAAFYILGWLVFLKLTGFMALGVALAYLWMVEWRFRYKEHEPFRRWARRCMVGGVLAGAVLAIFVMQHRGHVGPDGNLGYRMVTYRNAVNRFLSSPLYGASFDMSATARFTGFQIDAAHGHLPTHSDVLDLAANGGVLALGLLIWGYARILNYARKTIFSVRTNSELVAIAHTLACSMLTGVVVYAFNPILLEPDRALLLWSTTGMLLGMAICHKQITNLSTRKTRDEKRKI